VLRATLAAVPAATANDQRQLDTPRTNWNAN